MVGVSSALDAIVFSSNLRKGGLRIVKDQRASITAILLPGFIRIRGACPDPAPSRTSFGQAAPGFTAARISIDKTGSPRGQRGQPGPCQAGIVMVVRRQAGFDRNPKLRILSSGVASSMASCRWSLMRGCLLG